MLANSCLFTHSEDMKQRYMGFWQGYDLAFYFFNWAVFKLKLSWRLLSDLATPVVTFIALGPNH